MSYCSSLTDQQVLNVYIQEAERINRIEDESSPVRIAAIELLQEAKDEIHRRGLKTPQTFLRP